MKDIKLTSVKVLESLYKRFKIHTVNSNMTLQKITNRAINLYLNDNEGGSTSFPQLDLNTKCKKGSMLMFPPLWPWLHSGEKPIDKPKYILGSYLQYIA